MYDINDKKRNDTIFKRFLELGSRVCGNKKYKEPNYLDFDKITDERSFFRSFVNFYLIYYSFI